MEARSGRLPLGLVVRIRDRDIRGPGADRYTLKPCVRVRVNLIFILAGLALVELAAHRVAARLFFSGASADRGLGGLLGVVSGFLPLFVATLAGLIFVVSFGGMLRDRVLFPRSLRLASTIIAAFFVGLLALGLIAAHLPESLAVQLGISHAFLTWFIAAAVWRSGAAARIKVGVTFLALPAMLHAVALFLSHAGVGRLAALPGEVSRAGEVIGLLAGGLAPWLLPNEPFGGRFRGVGWILGFLFAILVVTMARVNFDLIHAVALYGLRLELPSPGSAAASSYLGLVALSLVGFVAAFLSLWSAGGRERLRAVGLLLLGVAGYGLASPPELAVAACGILAVARSLSEPVGV